MYVFIGTLHAEIGEFQGLVGSFISMVDGLAREVEREKMKAIGARNLLKSIAREREAQKQQLHALLAEKKMELERYVCMHALDPILHITKN